MGPTVWHRSIVALYNAQVSFVQSWDTWLPAMAAGSIVTES
jgi:hypothetical protein